MSVAELSKALSTSWPAIEKAQAETPAQFQKLAERLEGADSENESIVVFGSLARSEWTVSSDLDWTMLVDGWAEHRHALTAHRIGEVVTEAGFAKPGPTRTFGTLTFSHDLVHQIGGLDDSNLNTTPRLLLLLESKPVNRREAYDRVITGILRRYLQNDFRPFRLKVPRFLLNDLNRFWRTMCVDYASKYREQAGKKWCIRNVKLRLSRKLIFASGLLTCFYCDPGWISQRSPRLAANPEVEGLVEYLLEFVARTPLDILPRRSIRPPCRQLPDCSSTRTTRSWTASTRKACGPSWKTSAPGCGERYRVSSAARNRRPVRARTGTAFFR
jgi:predicted nucleotidyltransferase